jgi:hypothetical protein
LPRGTEIKVGKEKITLERDARAIFEGIEQKYLEQSIYAQIKSAVGNNRPFVLVEENKVPVPAMLVRTFRNEAPRTVLLTESEARRIPTQTLTEGQMITIDFGAESGYQPIYIMAPIRRIL